jgi:hypothetical protein
MTWFMVLTPCLNNPALPDNTPGKYPEAAPRVKRATILRGMGVRADVPLSSRLDRSMVARAATTMGRVEKPDPKP